MTFSAFVTTCEAVAATSKRLEKAALLGEYFRTLSDDDLDIAARFFAGTPFPQRDERVLSVGGALIRDAVLSVSGGERDQWQQLVVETGEAGRAAERLLAGHTVERSTVTLADVLRCYETIEQTRGPKAKAPIIADALRQLTPGEGAYFIKLMLGGDLRIGLLESSVEDALARVSGAPLKAVQRANMLLGDIGQTARLTRHGGLESARMRLFHPLKFMLATAITTLPEIVDYIPGPCLVEDKYDGIRAQVHMSGDRLAIYSRTMDEITDRFPELHDALRRLPGDLLLDGEILAARDGKVLPFKALQVRLGRRNVSEDVLASAPVVFIVYDLLFQDGTVLLDDPLTERRRRLDALVQTTFGDGPEQLVGGDIELRPVIEGPVMPSLQIRVTHTGADDVARLVDHLFAGARARGNEGLMVKAPDSTYTPGRRGREWLKVKRTLPTLDVVVTAAEVGHGNRRHLLSDLTFAVRTSADDATLLNLGKAYSGLTDAELTELTAWFREHTIEDFGKRRTVEPHVVLEVAFEAIQPSSRHDGGFALRFPRIVRLRTDKSAAEIDTLETVAALAAETNAQG